MNEVPSVSISGKGSCVSSLDEALSTRPDSAKRSPFVSPHATIRSFCEATEALTLIRDPPMVDESKLCDQEKLPHALPFDLRSTDFTWVSLLEQDEHSQSWNVHHVGHSRPFVIKVLLAKNFVAARQHELEHKLLATHDTITTTVPQICRPLNTFVDVLCPVLSASCLWSHPDVRFIHLVFPPFVTLRHFLESRRGLPGKLEVFGTGVTPSPLHTDSISESEILDVATFLAPVLFHFHKSRLVHRRCGLDAIKVELDDLETEPATDKTGASTSMERFRLRLGDCSNVADFRNKRTWERVQDSTFDPLYAPLLGSSLAPELRPSAQANTVSQDTKEALFLSALSSSSVTFPVLNHELIDSWALGVCLLEMMIWPENLPSTSDVVMLLEHQQSHPYQAALRSVKHCSQDLCYLVSSLLEVEPTMPNLQCEENHEDRNEAAELTRQRYGRLSLANTCRVLRQRWPSRTSHFQSSPSSICCDCNITFGRIWNRQKQCEVCKDFICSVCLTRTKKKTTHSCRLCEQTAHWV